MEILKILGTAVITLIGTVYAARYAYKGKQSETHSSVEGIYVENMQKIIETYQNDITVMKKDITDMKSDITILKSEIDKKDKIIEEKNKIIDDLSNKLRDAIAEIKYLKGDFKHEN